MHVNQKSFSAHALDSPLLHGRRKVIVLAVALSTPGPFPRLVIVGIVMAIGSLTFNMNCLILTDILLVVILILVQWEPWIVLLLSQFRSFLK